MRVVFVHGACVEDGSWWWHRAAQVLESRGVTSVAPLLPSCGETGVPGGTDGPGLADDVDAVRAVLQATDEPTVVVAHSYGGVVTAEAAADLDVVQHLVLVASYLPEPGQAMSDVATGPPGSFLVVDPAAGTFGVRPQALVDTFLHDCDAAVQEQGSAHLARQSVRVTGEPVGAAAWQHVPTTYVVCGRDRGTPAEAQRGFARRADHVVELDTGHHPFLSAPDLVADLVLSR